VSDLAIPLPDQLIEQIAQRVVELLAERQAPGSPWLTRPAAADYLGWPLSRLERRKDVPHHKHDGRVAYHRGELDRWLAEQ
jgi:hypothetical protein